MNHKGQAVFFAAIFGLAGIITFILVLPILLPMITYAMSQINNPFVWLLLGIIPIFLFIMIGWAILKIARSE